MSAGRSEPIGEPTMTPAEVAEWEARMRPRATKATTTGNLSSRVHGAVSGGTPAAPTPRVSEPASRVAHNHESRVQLPDPLPQATTGTPRPVTANGRVRGVSPSRPTSHATGTPMPGTHKDGRGGFPVSPSIVIPGSVIPRPSCKHIYGGRSAVTWNAVRPAPEQGVMSL